MTFQSTKIIELGSACFRQWRAESHCRFLHGYDLKCKVWVESETGLDEKNWVYDFGGFKSIRKKLQNVFDHKTCIAGDDPCLDNFIELEKKGIIDLEIFPDGVGIEKFSEYCYVVISAQLPANIIIRKVEVYEHSKNTAIYIRD